MEFVVENMKRSYKIAVIDYGMSNMFSIKNALEMLGFECIVTSDCESILLADGAILPGVGAFPEAMKRIKQFGLSEAIGEFISSGKPFMGICLGFQLLFEGSEEKGNAKGLGIIEGQVKNFVAGSIPLQVPHVGWNSVKKNELLQKNHVKDPLKNFEDGSYFYFVHSCYVCPSDEMNICSTTDYGDFVFCSSAWKDNVFGCQFHPEKSGGEGIRILSEIFSV